MLMSTYLAGGFYTNWQDIVIKEIEAGDHDDGGFVNYEINFFDPRSHGLTNPKEYTRWDLDAIDQSQVVLAYLDASNPAGWATASEIGYAKAKGKYIIFGCETQEILERKYWFMTYEMCDIVVIGLQKGIEELKKYYLRYNTAPMPYNM